jgi:DNA-binding FrmR family transcriptional regulator
MAADVKAKETIPAEELVRLRRIEDAAKKVLRVMEGKRSATAVLTAIAELRAALKEP